MKGFVPFLYNPEVIGLIFVLGSIFTSKSTLIASRIRSTMSTSLHGTAGSILDSGKCLFRIFLVIALFSEYRDSSAFTPYSLNAELATRITDLDTGHLWAFFT